MEGKVGVREPDDPDPGRGRAVGGSVRADSHHTGRGPRWRDEVAESERWPTLEQGDVLAALRESNKERTKRGRGEGFPASYSARCYRSGLGAGVVCSSAPAETPPDGTEERERSRRPKRVGAGTGRDRALT